MQLKLSDLVQFFIYLDNDFSANHGRQFLQITHTFLQVTQMHGLALVEWLRLCLPENDVARKYNCREDSLAVRLARVFGWIDTNYEQMLRDWRRKLHAEDDTAGDLSARLFQFMQSSHYGGSVSDNGSSGLFMSDLTVCEINVLLDKIASHCSWSDHQLLNMPKPVADSNPAYYYNNHQTKFNQRKDALDAVYHRLFCSCSPTEAKWLSRIILKDLKLPFTDRQLMVKVHQWMYPIYKVRNCLIAACVQMDSLFNHLNKERRGASCLDLDKRKWVCPQLGINVGIMECEKARSTFDVQKRYSNERNGVAVEVKYDGERIQCHIERKSDGATSLTIFNKSKRNSTQERQAAHQFILSGFGLAKKDFLERINFPFGTASKTRLSNCIVEGEILTFNELHEKIEKFGGVRQLQTMGGDGFANGDSRHFCIVWYDILYLNNENLLHQPYKERRRLLESLVFCVPHFVSLSERQIFHLNNDVAALKKFREYYIDLIIRREEGVIIKPLDSIYEPCGRGLWCKLKKDYIPGLGDTADFCVIGGCLSSETDTKFTKGDNRLGGMITKYIIGCVTNKDQILKHPDARPMFKIVFSVEAGQKEIDICDFEMRTFDSRLENCLYQKHAESLNLPFDILPLKKSGISWRSIDFWFPCPHIFELLGGGFTREFDDGFYSLRFPRIIKVRTDIQWRDCISFQELQRIAKDSFEEPLDYVAEREMITKIVTDLDEYLVNKKGNKRTLYEADMEEFRTVSKRMFSEYRATPRKRKGPLEIPTSKSSPVAQFIQESENRSPLIASPPNLSITQPQNIFDRSLFFFFDQCQLTVSADTLQQTGFIAQTDELAVGGQSRIARTLSTLHALLTGIGWYDNPAFPVVNRHGVIFVRLGQFSKFMIALDEFLKTEIDINNIQDNLYIYNVEAVSAFLPKYDTSRNLNRYLLWQSSSTCKRNLIDNRL